MLFSRISYSAMSASFYCFVGFHSLYVSFQSRVFQNFFFQNIIAIYFRISLLCCYVSFQSRVFRNFFFFQNIIAMSASFYCFVGFHSLRKLSEQGLLEFLESKSTAFPSEATPCNPSFRDCRHKYMAHPSL